MTQKNGVYAKMAKIIGMKLYVQKKGYNQFHKYKYATEADILDCLRKAFSEVGLIYTMSTTSSTGREVITEKGNKQWVTDISSKFNIIDVETGESLELLFPGSGIDSGDKGLYKALTGCQKYFLAKNFMIETGDDPQLSEDYNANSASDHGNNTGYSKPIPKPSAPAKTKEELETEIGNRFSSPTPKPTPAPIKYISAGQVKLLTSVLKDNALSPSDLCKAFGITSLDRLPATEMAKAIKWRP